MSLSTTESMPRPSRTGRQYAYYDLVMAAFVGVLLCSNFIGAAKQAVIDLPVLGPIPFSAGILFFPISYIFGDILTEVYGYGRDRRVVWAGLDDVIRVALAQYALKTTWEVLMTPVTYRVVGFLKRKENEDYYDRDTDFNPFRLKA